MKDKMKDYKPRGKAQNVIDTFRKVIANYRQTVNEGMTIRQIHYQFVAKYHWPNTPETYRTIQRALNDGRKGGLVDYDDINDSARSSFTETVYQTSNDFLSVAHAHYKADIWAGQPKRVELWTEKDAVFGLAKSVAIGYRVDTYSCRGCNSTTEKYEAVKRIRHNLEQGYPTVILYLGDHDPSGLRMDSTYLEFFRDNKVSSFVEFKRIGLTIAQVVSFELPHTLHDSEKQSKDNNQRWYEVETGQSEAWELDALGAATLSSLIKQAIVSEVKDVTTWNEAIASERENRQRIADMIARLNA